MPFRSVAQHPQHRVALGVGAVLALLVVGAIAGETGTGGLLAGFLLATLPLPVYVTLALWLDRFEAEPAHLLGRAFGWGATVAFLTSLVLNTAFEAATGSEVAGAVLAAPLTEELSKGFALLLLFLQRHDEFDNVTDGIVYATLVGLGFAMTENVLYYGRALADGSTATVFVLRGVVAPFAHPLFTAMTGFGLGAARESHRPGVCSLAPVLGLAAAIGLHALWNLSAYLDGWFEVVYVGLMVPAFLATGLAVRRSLRREGDVIRAHLAPLVVGGELSEREMHCLCSVRVRLRMSWRTLRRRGVGPWRERGRFHQTASELAFHRWRTARGISAGPEVDAARDAEYLAELRALIQSCAKE